MFCTDRLKRLIGGLYLHISDQKEVEEAHIQNMQSLNRPTNILSESDQQYILGETQQQLETTQAIIGNLNQQLDEAISQWCSLPSAERETNELPWPGFPGPPADDSCSSSSSSDYSSDESESDEPQQHNLADELSQAVPSWRPRNSLDFWADPMYVPNFWQYQLGDRDLWTEVPSGRAQDDIEYSRPISPKTVEDFTWDCSGSLGGEEDVAWTAGPSGGNGAGCYEGWI
ncbi:hypothetical protein QBC38DRAFT_456987 [Podospora fimiseda]|uniref:Uncharacterized protein n=1 Tax=Podospora fimiseda TaxID=252190 RepID=A0AAN7GWF3_9PEZI|nr:hypothetical protein QBC38DRAFT_456987 [Podospora fimiseda]